MGKHVCFLVSEHPFLDARIFKKEAKSLLKQGYHVTMIVPRKDGYLFDTDGSSFTERFLDEAFTYEGINVITYGQINMEKYLNELYHNLRSGGHSRFNDPLTQIGIEQEADIYHAHEFISAYSGIGIKRALAASGKQCKLIYDSHELEPDPLMKQPRKTYRTKEQMVKHMIKELDYVITVSDSIKEWYRTIDPQLPVQVIYNSPPLAANYESKKADNPELTLVYEGVISQKRGNFQQLMSVLDRCNKKFKLKLNIIGGGKNFEKEYVPKIPPHLKDKVYYTGWVDYESIPEVMKDADLGWIDLDAANSLNNRFAMPNKFFSYLNNGVPVIVNQCTDMEKLIEAHDCGYVVKKLQATTEDYVQALVHMESNRNKIRKKSIHAREAMETTYSWEHMEGKIFAIYDQLIKDM
ncbi:glycosyltransferase [Lentibacillus juripiscarius]|uniref:Glycosyltransferase n=1 Tax=Lentibacillus juripiscarius TaxID=257446 RepID=A0ABW5V5V9_9BACI